MNLITGSTTQYQSPPSLLSALTAVLWLGDTKISESPCGLRVYLWIKQSVLCKPNVIQGRCCLIYQHHKIKTLSPSPADWAIYSLWTDPVVILPIQVLIRSFVNNIGNVCRLVLIWFSELWHSGLGTRPGKSAAASLLSMLNLHKVKYVWHCKPSQMGFQCMVFCLGIPDFIMSPRNRCPTVCLHGEQLYIPTPTSLLPGQLSASRQPAGDIWEALTRFPTILRAANKRDSKRTL